MNTEISNVTIWVKGFLTYLTSPPDLPSSTTYSDPGTVVRGASSTLGVV